MYEGVIWTLFLKNPHSQHIVYYSQFVLLQKEEIFRLMSASGLQKYNFNLLAI
jgi:hypothetical protein